MFSIKNSFADCMGCKLFEEPSCILETNCEDDLSKVDIVFVAENPGKDEIKQEKPLVGKAGKTFRKYFEKYDLNKKNYLLTNTVLCQTIDPDTGKTGNPDPDTLERCKINCFKIVEACKPKLIVLMGSTPMKAFGIAEKGITSIHEKYRVYKKDNNKFMVIVHPSFVNRQHGAWEDKFEKAFQEISKKMGDKLNEKTIVTESHVKSKVTGKGIYHYQIPEEYYTDKYRLVDIQYLKNTKKVLYIFRDEKNKKKYFTCSDQYICYQTPEGVEAPKIIPFDELEQVEISYGERYHLDSSRTYEGDMKITAKHAIDYYYFNKAEAKIDNMNIMFFDIEVDAGINNKAFPNPTEALYPINMIAAIYQNPKKKILYVLDNKTEPINKIEGTDFKIFNNEKKLIEEFIKDWKKYDPDYVAGWNLIPFDMEYIYNRMKKIKIYQHTLSRYGEVYVDGNKNIASIAGTVVLDQLHLYKSFTFTNKENYKLGFIAQEELGVSKIELPLPMNEMYWKMLNKTIEYNIRDTDLLEGLEDKLGHINLLRELREICNASFDSAGSGFGQVDCTMISFLRKKGIASKNADPHIKKDKYPGAYVHPPIPDVYDYVTDFDFTSLYPSVIITYNIGVNNFVMRTKNSEMGYNIAYYPEKLPDTIDMIIDPTYKQREVSVDTKELLKTIKEKNLVNTINGCFFKGHENEMSVYAQVLEHLLSSRRAYKKKMLDAKETGEKDVVSFFNTKQLVYKVLANTLYGVIANKAFRFFDLSCAGAITLGGQEAIKNSIIYGEAYMEKLHYKREKINLPKPITQDEMYSDKMPDRNNLKYIVTGDTDSIFTCFQEFPGEKTVEKIKNWCDELQDYLNQDIMKMIVNSHNVSMKYNRLDLKNELIIKRGLFLAKKRYVINVINNEGRKVNEIKFMGLDVKRADFAAVTKEFVRELVDLIMTNEHVNLPEINKFINRRRSDFINLINSGDKSIGKPVGFGKPLKDYKTIPQGVRGLLAFNEIVYHAHVVGSRGYLFQVNGIDLEKAPDYVVKNYNQFISKGGKLEAIAIPDEEPKLPAYFIPNTKGMLKFVFEDRHKILLAPLFQNKKQEGVMTF